MKKRFWIGLAAVLGVLVLGVVVFLWVAGPRRDSFRYQGKSAEEWSLQLFGSPTQAGREEAAAAFKQMGASAVPLLIRQLRTRDPFFRQQAWTAGSALPARVKYRIFGRLRPLEAVLLRAAAARSLAAIGPEAADAVPDLARALGDRSTQVSLDAATALGHIGAASVPELTRSLQNNNPEVRHLAAYALGEVGSAAAPAVPALVNCLSDTNEYVRSSSKYSLGKIGEPARRALLETVSTGSGIRRQAAAAALDQFPSVESIQPLLAMLSDADAGCREAAITALTKLHAFNSGVATNLPKALSDPAPEVRLAAVKALSEIPYKARTAVPTLIPCLRDPVALVRIQTAKTLGKVGPQANAALPALNELTTDKNEAVRAAATDAIAQITQPTESRPGP